MLYENFPRNNDRFCNRVFALSSNVLRTWCDTVVDMNRIGERKEWRRNRRGLIRITERIWRAARFAQSLDSIASLHQIFIVQHMVWGDCSNYLDPATQWLYDGWRMVYRIYCMHTYVIHMYMYVFDARMKWWMNRNWVKYSTTATDLSHTYIRLQVNLLLFAFAS